METIFDFLNSILFSKKKICINDENKNTYVPYLINRWLSFYSKDITNIINQSVNRYTNLTRDEHYAFLKNILPKLPFKRLEYVKKKKEEKTKQDEMVDLLAKNLELSKREINQYILCQ
jgi:hypothetical protein